MRIRLQNKIFLTLILVGLGPLVFLGVLSVYSLNLFHQADLETIENNLLNQKGVEVTELLTRIEETFLLQVAFEQVADIELSQQIFLLEQFLKDLPALDEVAFISLSGRQTSAVDREFGLLPDAELQDYGQIEQFQTARSGRNFVSPVHFTLAGPAITLATPVRNRNGTVIAVLSGKMNLKDLGRILRASYLGQSGYVYALDTSGVLVGHSQPDRISGVGLDRPGRAIAARYQSFWGEPVVGSRKPVGRLGLTLVAEWPVSEADSVVSTVRGQLLMCSGIIFFIALVASVFLTFRIVRPIRMLARGTALVAEGKFDQPVNIKTGDEIEGLGAAFNDMLAGLKRLEELKEEFVFIAAHELRTPVTAIKGYLSMVMDGDAGPVSPEAREMIGQVIAANKRLTQLVEDLLQVARSEAGRLQIEVAAVEVSGPVAEVFRELAPLAAEKQISLVYEPEAQMPKIMADSQRLREVLVNLVGNAIKYTPSAGTVTITHTLAAHELVTHVSDTGFGISAEAQKRLFEKFYRVATKATAGITGTGLGLFIVKQIVEKMNGRIWVESEEGRGSTFSFSLKIV